MIFSETVEKLMPGDTVKLFLVDLTHNELRELPGHKNVSGNPRAVFSLRDCWALRQAQIHIFTEENIEQPCPHLGQYLPAFSLCIPIMTYGELIGLFHISGQTQNQNLDKLEQKKSWQGISLSISSSRWPI